MVIRPPPLSTLFPYTTLFRSTIHPASTATKPIGVASATARRSRRLCARSARRHASHPAHSATSARYVPTATMTRNERSEEHTSELQSHHDLVCRLLLEKKKNS